MRRAEGAAERSAQRGHSETKSMPWRIARLIQAIWVRWQKLDSEKIIGMAGIIGPLPILLDSQIKRWKREEGPGCYPHIFLTPCIEQAADGLFLTLYSCKDMQYTILVVWLDCWTTSIMLWVFLSTLSASLECAPWRWRLFSCLT